MKSIATNLELKETSDRKIHTNDIKSEKKSKPFFFFSFLKANGWYPEIIFHSPILI